MIDIGIMFAFIAMLFWGFGDFFIQKSLRKIGDAETLFLDCLLCCILILPFIINEIKNYQNLSLNTVIILLISGLVLFLAAVMEFESLKIGKISVIESSWSVEILMASFLGFILIGEIISPLQIIIIFSLILGLFLISYEGKLFKKKFFIEKGFSLGIFAALVMGAANYFIGIGGRETSPLFINFIVSFISLILITIYLLYKKRITQPFKDFKKYPKLILVMTTLDNIAWIAFAYAMIYTKIGVATAISESYIIIAVLLGVFINKDKLQKHQKIGLVIAVISFLILSYVS